MNERNLVNLTPHTINILGPNGQLICDVPPTQDVARVSFETKEAEPILIGYINGERVEPFLIPTFVPHFGDVSNLTLAPNDIAITSAMVKMRARALGLDIHVVSPGMLARNADGTPQGCYGLSW